MNFSELPPVTGEGQIRVVIETTKGSGSKFKHDPIHDIFTLHRVLPRGLIFPYDFGFIPSTRSEDGDPLDVLLLSETGLVPGCVVCSRLIGVIKISQKEGGKVAANDRIIAVDPQSALWSETKELDGLPKKWRKELEHFFCHYRMPGAIEVSIKGHLGARGAQLLLQEGIQRARNFRRRKRR